MRNRVSRHRRRAHCAQLFAALGGYLFETPLNEIVDGHVAGRFRIEFVDVDGARRSLLLADLPDNIASEHFELIDIEPATLSVHEISKLPAERVRETI